MTNDNRAALVDLAILGVASVAVYYVVKTPSLRRAAWRLLKFGLLTVGPEAMRREFARAWADTERPPTGFEARN